MEDGESEGGPKIVRAAEDSSIGQKPAVADELYFFRSGLGNQPEPVQHAKRWFDPQGRSS